MSKSQNYLGSEARQGNISHQICSGFIFLVLKGTAIWLQQETEERVESVLRFAQYCHHIPYTSFTQDHCGYLRIS